MNKETPYEELITQKILQQPLPDMADGIWAAITLELDAPVPDSVHEAPKPVRKWLRYVVPCFVVISVLTWLLLHKKPARQAKNPSPQEAPGIQKVEALADSGEHAIDKIDELKHLPIFPHTSRDTVQHIPIAIPLDSTAGDGPIYSPVIADSNLIQPPQNPTVKIDSGDVSPPVKKPKGVPGISGKDYRIEGNKKDSGGIKK